MISYEHEPNNIKADVTVTEFRRFLAHYIAMVRYGGDRVRIRRKGMEPVFLVSRADLGLILEKVSDLEIGEKDPETGRRPGSGFMTLVWESLRAERRSNGETR